MVSSWRVASISDIRQGCHSSCSRHCGGLSPNRLPCLSWSPSRQKNRTKLRAKSLIKNIFPFALAALLVILAAFSGLSQTLGAHPFWATQIALIGAPAGAVLAIILRFATRFQWTSAFAALVLTGLALAMATMGKTRFAASYAEDVQAGQLWYFGWIAVALFATTTLALMWPKPR